MLVDFVGTVRSVERDDVFASRIAGAMVQCALIAEAKPTLCSAILADRRRRNLILLAVENGRNTIVEIGGGLIFTESHRAGAALK